MLENIEDHLSAYKAALSEYATILQGEITNKMAKIAARKKLNDIKDNLRAFELDLFEKDGETV